MAYDNLEPAIDMWAERNLLRTLLKMRMQDHLFANGALQMLSTDEAIKYLLATEKGIQRIADDLAFAEELLNEHLDAFIPTHLLLEELTSK